MLHVSRVEYTMHFCSTTKEEACSSLHLWVITIRCFFFFLCFMLICFTFIVFLFSTRLGLHLFSLDVYHKCNSDLPLGIIAFKLRNFWESLFSFILYLGEFFYGNSLRTFVIWLFPTWSSTCFSAIFCSQQIIIVPKTYSFLKALVLLLHLFFFKLRWVFGVCAISYLKTEGGLVVGGTNG